MPDFPASQQQPPSTQRIAGALRSVLNASQELITSNPEAIHNLRQTYLQFYAHPVFTLILGIPSQNSASPQTPQPLQKQLDTITSSIQALSKTVEGLKPFQPTHTAQTTPAPPSKKAPQQGQGKSAITPPTYATKAAEQARPSLVFNFGARPISPEDRRPVSDLCQLLNSKLLTTQHALLRIAAAKWTAKGNLVLTASHNNTQLQLNLAGALLKKYVTDIFDNAPIVRANVKWSKILINGVPTGAGEDRGPHTPGQCHEALLAENPTYATLNVTQKPSWVRTPSSYAPNSTSSLTVSFEDPDGAKLKELLAVKCFFIFGTAATTKCWNTNPHTKPAKAAQDKAQPKPPHPIGNMNDEEDIESSVPTIAQTNTLFDSPFKNPGPPSFDPPFKNPGPPSSSSLFKIPAPKRQILPRGAKGK